MIFSKGSGINDDLFKGSQAPIKKFLLDTEAVAMKEHQVMEAIFNTMDSEEWAVKFTSLTGKGLFEDVGENGAYPSTDQQQGYSKIIEDKEWKQSFKVTKTMIEDNKMVDIKKEASNFVSSYYRTRSQFAAAMLNAGASTTFTFGSKVYDNTCQDTLALFSIAHTYKAASGTWANYFNAGFSYDNLCRVEELMQKFKTDSGEYADIQPDTIIIPNNARIKRQVADAIWTNGDQRPGTSDHSYNYQCGRWNVITWNYLSNPSGITSGYDCWYLMDSRYNQMCNGIVFVNRIPLQVKSWVDENTDANNWGGRARFHCNPVDPRAIVMCAAGLGNSIAES
jgi:hypothetical protein